MKVIECWDVQEWDGGDRNNHSYYITQASVDEAALKLRHPHGCFIKKTIVVFESFGEVDDNSIEKLRRSAWNKLTPQERAAFGLVRP